MAKMLWSKLKFLLPNEGRHGKEEDMDSLVSKSKVDEEYKQAFRTKSYIEICNKVQHHLDEGQSAAASSPPPPPPPPSSLSSSPSPPPIQINHLSEYLLEPYQESLINSISDSSNFHKFLANYFEISQEACRICESLLTNIHQARNNHRRIKKATNLIKRLPDTLSCTNDEYNILYKNLSSFASRENPFSTMSPAKFQELRETHLLLLQELTSKCMKIRRKRKMIKFIKRVISSFLVMGCGALAIILLVFTMHFMLGLVAAPGLVIWSIMAKKMKRAERKCNEKWLERVVAKLDIAARGVYIMINDFATMGQIVKGLRDELEHRKCLAYALCVRKGKNEMMMLKQVARELQVHESCFIEQLEELEMQIYLCFLDINRSRRLLVREMVE